MPSTISRTPRLPPRLMICSSAGTTDSPPSRPKRLVPVYLTSMKRSKPSASMSLLRIAFLPIVVKSMPLSRTLDALLDPRLLLRIGDVHELDAERRAVGAPEDLQHLGDGGEFQPEHVIEEDAAAEIGLGETVGAGIELALRRQFGHAERIEIGVEMAAHAVGADHHQGAHRIARRLGHRALADLGAAAADARLDLLAERGSPAPPSCRRAPRPARRSSPAASPDAATTPRRLRRWPRQARPSVPRRSCARRHRPNWGRRHSARGVVLCKARSRRKGRKSPRMPDSRPDVPSFRFTESLPLRSLLSRSHEPRSSLRSSRFQPFGQRKKWARALLLQDFDQSAADAGGRVRYHDSGRFHGLDLVAGAAAAAGNDRAGMTHAPPGRRRQAGDEADHRLARGRVPPRP